MQIIHPLKPFYNANSEILILGTMPSKVSREHNFYYMHPQNRFWHVLELVYQEDIEDSIEAKCEFLTRHKIALWDTIKSCTITGSSDVSIKNIEPNDINLLLKQTNIKEIYTTGKKAYEIYHKYIYPETKIKATYLYSPSPANCAIALDKMVENYQVINKEK